jgi:predicted DsbA family dithiol-disulfide isomerase
MNRTDASEPSAPLIALGDQDVAVCADGGLDFDFGAALTVNTLDAHRLLHLAAHAGVGDAAKERLLRAHFTEGADAVRADFDEARMLGANGVPFFVIDRTYGVSGAQPAETFRHALRTAYAAEDAAAR